MHRRIFAALLLCAASAPAFAAGEDDAALAPVRQFIDGVNKADMNSAAAAYAPGATIIDEYPPYYWQGEHAFADWGASLDAASKAAGTSDPLMTLETPSQVAVTGNTGYAVIPARYDFKEHGRPVHEDGTFTFALTKTGAGWRIAGWSWSWRAISK